MFRKIKIVDRHGNPVKHEGKDAVFDEKEKERAESLLWMMNKKDSNGPFRLVPCN